MTSGIVRATDRFTIPDVADLTSLVEHRREETRRAFAGELVKALSERGGIVGPIHEQESTQPDWMFNPESTTHTFTVYARVTSLPSPEQYRLVGGPADGMIVRTGGVPTWRVPYLAPVSYATTPFDVATEPSPQYAEYERQGDSQVYLYRRVAA